MPNPSRRNKLPRLTSSDGRANPAHAGLVLARYVEYPCANTPQFRDARRELHEAAIRAAHTAQPLYQSAFTRWLRSFARDPNDRNDPLAPRKFRVIDRLIVGLGGENVLETGLTLHHTYGTPLIPGTALKGLAWHYCHQVWGTHNAGFRRGQELHTYLFGSTDQQGSIAFHDAWISPSDVKSNAADRGLLHDVITPHHGEYYTGDASRPTDFDNPVPVPFLSVRGTFFIPLSTRHAGPEAELDRELGYKLLRHAMQEWGVGGKTKSGYGRLEPASSGSAAPSGRRA